MHQLIICILLLYNVEPILHVNSGDKMVYWTGDQTFSLAYAVYKEIQPTKGKQTAPAPLIPLPVTPIHFKWV